MLYVFILIVLAYTAIQGIADHARIGTYAMLGVICFFQNVMFVFVSRSRNRQDSLYHFLSALGSNGIWFLVFAQLVPQHMPVDLLIPFLGGTTLGALFGAHVAIMLEKKLGARADALTMTGNKRWVSILILCGVISALYGEHTQTALVLGVSSYLQGILATMSSRARNRATKWYMISTTVAGGLFFLFSVTILFTEHMSFALILPYIAGTVSGSLHGAYISARIEKYGVIVADEHVKNGVRTAEKGVHLVAWRILLTGVIGVGFFGMMHTEVLIFLTVAILCFGEKFFYTVSSRAANRNNMNYHLVFRIANGIFWFFMYKEFLAIMLHTPFLFLAAPAICGWVLGTLVGVSLAENIEIKIYALMDPAPPREKPRS